MNDVEEIVKQEVMSDEENLIEMDFTEAHFEGDNIEYDFEENFEEIPVDIKQEIVEEVEIENFVESPEDASLTDKVYFGEKSLSERITRVSN